MQPPPICPHTGDVTCCWQHSTTLGASLVSAVAGYSSVPCSLSVSGPRGEQAFVPFPRPPLSPHFKPGCWMRGMEGVCLTISAKQPSNSHATSHAHTVSYFFFNSLFFLHSLLRETCQPRSLSYSLVPCRLPSLNQCVHDPTTERTSSAYSLDRQRSGPF
jgi:hypothetical protein